MVKDFMSWHTAKDKIDTKVQTIYFKEREIWWCSLGLNIGYEQDGKDEDFSRPVLILKQFNLWLFWALPLTSVKKEGKHYFAFKLGDNIEESTVILSQLRLLDSKRLLRKMGTMNEDDFQKTRGFIREYL